MKEMTFGILKTSVLFMLLVVFFSLKNIRAEGTYSNPVLVEVVNIKNL